MAVSIPLEFRDMDQTLIPEKLKDADNIRYILLSEKAPSRFPKRGWLTGSIADIAAAIRVEATPVSELKEAAQMLEEGIEKAADIVKAAREERPKIGRQMEACLRQAPSDQTDRMAMLIISNAFVFQSTLAGIPRMEDVPALTEFEETYGKIDPSQILSAWQQITEVNYHPIFNVAIRLVKALYSDGKRVAEVLSILRGIAQKLVYAEIAQVHELAGIVFQKLITNRKFTKANYTFPESAALLCALVLPKKLPADIRDLKVADFACGTGALLNGAYQRMICLHEQSEKNESEDTQENLRHVHQYMMENNLVGCDIMPNAVHITASIIASTHPSVEIDKTRIHCMKYGDIRKDGFYSIGALNLLRNPERTLPLDISKSDTVGGHGDIETEERSEFRHEEFDYVIMNPPYTKSNSDIKTNLPKTIFGDHENGAEMRKTLKAQKSKIGNFQAGLGTFFFDLADKMLKPKGTLGFVLPASALTGVDWYKLRNLLAREYHNIVVITIADGDVENSTFSADTSMAECFVVATKGCVAGNTGRAKFVTLNCRPESELEALEIANSIRKIKNVQKLEVEITGGNLIKVGDDTIGRVISAPLRQDKIGWLVVRVRDISVAQSAHHLANGTLWLPGAEPLQLPICQLEEMATIGYCKRDISGDERGGFYIEKGCPTTADYPGLWSVDSKVQRTMAVEPDVHLLPHPNRYKQVQKVVARNSRVHYNESLRFNSHPLTVLFTEKNTIGVTSAPNIVFTNLKYDYVWTLWGNSTLGLLCYWGICGKQQSGRGRGSKASLLAMPTLDVRTFNMEQLTIAEGIFDELKCEEMLPFNEMDHDPVRQSLDRLLLSEVLGFHEDDFPRIHKGLARLREKLSAEPSITGTK